MWDTSKLLAFSSQQVKTHFIPSLSGHIAHFIPSSKSKTETLAEAQSLERQAIKEEQTKAPPPHTLLYRKDAESFLHLSIFPN